MAITIEAGSTHDDILDATDRLLGRYGMKKLTMEDIATEARVSRRTIYEYFPTKKDLVLASIDRVVRKAQTQMEEDAATSVAAAERLFRMLCSRVMVRINAVQDLSRSLDSMFAEIRSDYMNKRQAYFDTEAKMIAAILREGQASRVFGTFNVDETANLLVRATNAYLPYSLSIEELGHPKQIEESIEKLAAILVAGILR